MIAGFCNLPTGLFANRPVYYEIDYPPRLDFSPLLHILPGSFRHALRRKRNTPPHSQVELYN